MSNPGAATSLKKFALVDDDLDDATLFAEAVMEIDPEIEIEQASNGLELLTKMKSGLLGFPDVIFLDINMPEMNGWDCLIALKSSPELRQVPVIMYSTSSTIQDKSKAASLGASFFFTKPDNFQALKKFLKDLIQNPGAVLISNN